MEKKRNLLLIATQLGDKAVAAAGNGSKKCTKNAAGEGTPVKTGDNGDKPSQTTTKKGLNVSPVLSENRGQTGDKPGTGGASAVEKSPEGAWADAVWKIARRWERFQANHGWAPVLCEELDLSLQEEYGSAIRAADIERAFCAIDRWRRTWQDLLARTARISRWLKRITGGDLGRLDGHLTDKERRGELTGDERLRLTASRAELRARAGAAVFETKKSTACQSKDSADGTYNRFGLGTNG